MGDSRVPAEKNAALCMAPWTHTYLSPWTERRLCCASRERSSFVQQYIDQPGRTGPAYEPKSLEEHWNGEHMRSVRRRILAGEKLPECQVCNESVLSLSTYRHWFTEEMFPHLKEAVYSLTDETGATTLLPRSFDYRFDNSCNFKCRMCGDQFSSAWEAENASAGRVNLVRDPWKEPSVRARIRDFHRTVIDAEFAQAIREGRVEELYWVGGEPLLWEQHWRYMKDLVDLGFANRVYARYNTNLSVIERQGINLFRDLLPHFKDYMISASIDGAGRIGEFIRSGLNWKRWLMNFEQGVRASQGRSETAMMFDVTLTLPGLFSVRELLAEALRLDVRMEVKLIYAFDPFVILSPLALPKKVLHDFLDDLISEVEPIITVKQQALLHTLKDLKQRPTFEEQWPVTFRSEFERGRAYLLDVGRRRGDGQEGRLSYDEIYSSNPAVLNWWQS